MARPIYQITAEIVQDMKREYLEGLQSNKKNVKHWKEKYFYFTTRGSQMEAMLTMNNVDDNYGMDSGSYVIACALGNLSTWKGEKAREIKKELQAMIR